MSRDALRTYLNHHLAGSVMAIELCERTISGRTKALRSRLVWRDCWRRFARISGCCRG